LRSPSRTAARIKLWARFFRHINYQSDLSLVIHAFRHRRVLPIPNSLWELVDPVSGFLSRKEAALLHWAAREWPVPGPVLELGSYEGRSTIIFACAGREVYSIDAWSLDVADRSAFDPQEDSAEAVFNRFRDHLRRANVEAQVTTRRGLTHEVGLGWTIPGAILFVDAGHSYQDVKGDLALWTPHLLPGGLLLMHDVLGDAFLGVTRAASELLREGWNVVASAGSLVAFIRG
jgi:predicted O-methyltransferase YrrM